MVAIVKASGKEVRLRPFNNGTFGVFGDSSVYTKDELIFPSTNKKEFIKELKALLKKYNACISWTCSDGSDTYGIYDDHMYACLNDSVEIEFEDNCIDCDSLKTR